MRQSKKQKNWFLNKKQKNRKDLTDSDNRYIEYYNIIIPSLKNHGNFKVFNLMTPHFFILKVQVHVEDDPARIFKATEVGTITQVINVIFV